MRIQIVVIPAEPHFKGDRRTVRTRESRFNNAGSQWDILHQCRSRLPPGNLFGRATHVDVNNVDACFTHQR